MSAPAPWRVRDALDEDRDDLIEMMRALQAYELRFDPNRSPPATMARPHIDGVWRWAAQSQGSVLVCVRDESGNLHSDANMLRPVAFLAYGVVEEQGGVVARENQRHGVITDLFVREEHRAAGAAHALVDEARERFRDLGVRRLEVTALWANAGARAAYEAMGLSPSHLTYAETLPKG